MLRGEVWTVAGGGDYTGKPRPVVIVKDDAVQTQSVTVCSLTTVQVSALFARVQVEPSGSNGLRQTSWLMADKLTTVNRNRMGQRIGSLASAEMDQLGRAILVFLGLARKRSA